MKASEGSRNFDVTIFALSGCLAEDFGWVMVEARLSYYE